MTVGFAAVAFVQPRGTEMAASVVESSLSKQGSGAGGGASGI